MNVRRTSSTRLSTAPMRVQNTSGDSAKKFRLSSVTGSASSQRSTFSCSRLSSSAKKPLSKQPSLTNSDAQKRRFSGRTKFSGQDPRPLSQKQYKDRSIAALIEFLTLNKYPHQIPTPQIFNTTLRIKDFINIFEFLVSFVEPGFKLNGKHEEVIPRVLKSYSYPFTIPKSTMLTITPLNWPSLLGALTFLREQIQYTMNLDVDKMFGSNDFETSAHNDKLFFEHVEKTYKLFMRGEDNFEEETKEFEEQLRLNGLGGNVELLTAENKQLRLELQALEAAPDSLAQLRLDIAVAKEDRRKLEEYSSVLDRHVLAHDDSRKDAIRARQEAELQLQLVLAENEKKRKICEQQEMSQSDVQQINLRRRKLQSDVEQLSKECSDLDQQIWDVEIQFSKRHDQMASLCSQYVKAASNLGDFIQPELATLPPLNDIEVFNSEIKSNYKPALVQLEYELNKKRLDLQRQLAKEKEEFEQVDDLIKEKEGTIAASQKEIKRLDEMYESKKEIYQREQEEEERALERMRKELDELRLSNFSLQDGERLLEKEKLEAQAQEARESIERQSYATKLEALVNLIANHQMEILEQYKKMADEVEKREAEERAAFEEWIKDVNV